MDNDAQKPTSNLPPDPNARQPNFSVEPSNPGPTTPPPMDYPGIPAADQPVNSEPASLQPFTPLGEEPAASQNVASGKRFQLRAPKLREIIIGVLTLIVAGTALQFAFPDDKLLPGVEVRGVKLAGYKRSQAKSQLEATYKDAPLELTYGQADTTVLESNWGSAGLKVDSAAEIDAYQYPWQMRLVPTSVFWYGYKEMPAESKFSWDGKSQDKFINRAVGEKCMIDPINATIVPDGDKVALEKSITGGKCEHAEIKKALQAAKPKISQTISVKVPLNEPIEPAITDQAAQELVDSLNERLAKKVRVRDDKRILTLETDQVVSWLVFPEKKDKLTFKIDNKKSADYLNETLGTRVAVEPGVTKVTYKDLKETSRKTGTKGRGVDVEKMGALIEAFLSGDDTEMKVVTKTLPPTVEETHDFTATNKGFAALMKQFDQSHDGEYSVYFKELGKKKRQASHRASQKLAASSLDKLFISYGAGRQVDAGKWKWSENIDASHDLSECIADTLSENDSNCARVIQNKIGGTEIAGQLNRLGLSRTEFAGSGFVTTAADAGRFMELLESRQLGLQKATNNRLIDGAKKGQYRQGVTKQLSGTIANKVAYTREYKHDVAIVESTKAKGPYVLVIMTKDADWHDIETLTRRIDALR